MSVVQDVLELALDNVINDVRAAKRLNQSLADAARRWKVKKARLRTRFYRSEFEQPKSHGNKFLKSFWRSEPRSGLSLLSLKVVC